MWGGMFCDLDFDGDGIINGVELGDLDCDWVKGWILKCIENIIYLGKIIFF